MARVETAAGANDIESEPGGSTANFENGDEEVKLYPNMPCTPDQFTGICNPIKLDGFRCVPCYIPSNDPGHTTCYE